MLPRLSIATVVALAVFLSTTSLVDPAFGQAGLQITEVDPDGDQVEVTNMAAAQSTAFFPFCHQFNYSSAVGAGTSFAAGETKLFAVSGLNDVDTDLWLYQSFSFFDGNAIISGLKYGPNVNVGRTGVASGVGLWPSASAHAPAPPAGTTLAYDGFGFTPADWYIDETPTMGTADSTPVGSVTSELSFPSGVQTFEDVFLGDEVEAIAGWSKDDDSPSPGMFTVRCVNDVQGNIVNNLGSSRWLRIHDQNDADEENSFSTSAMVASAPLNYEFSFFVNVEAMGGGAAPRLMVQHHDGSDFADAWGLEFSGGGGNVVVTDMGGFDLSVGVFSLIAPTGLGDWIQVNLGVSFETSTLQVAINGGTPIALPINLDSGADKQNLRLRFDGSGSGNSSTVLIDDLTVIFEEPPVATYLDSFGQVKARF